MASAARPSAAASASRPAARWMRARSRDSAACAGMLSQRRIVRGAEDVLRLAELAQVDQGGGEREQRLDMAGIRRDPGAVPRRIAQQLKRRR